MNVTLVHDYLTQRGGAERVALAMARAFPEAPLHTSLFEPELTFPDFSTVDVRPSPLNRVAPLRHNHRLALPLLAPTFSLLRVPGDVVICSSSGWAHGVSVEGRKVVYCYAPARWLYQSDRYLGAGRPWMRGMLAAISPPLRRWDRRRARDADLYITLSSAVRRDISSIYGIHAELLPPPCPLDPAAPQRCVQDLEPGFLVTVARLLPYKNVDVVVRAMAELPDERLVVVGAGPDRSQLEASAPSNVRFIGTVSDAELRWLYANCAALVAASHEDYGLTTIEGLVFGKPSIVLRWGGFLDTVVEGVTGVFFDTPEPAAIASAVGEFRSTAWSATALAHHASRYSEQGFIAALRTYVAAVGA